MTRNLKDYTLVVDTLVRMDEIELRMIPQPSGCIEWKGPFHRQGYGMYGGVRVSDHKRIMFTVHRFLMKHHLGRALALNEMVIHTCSNFKCCNIDHLIVGNGKTRNKVMKDNGRQGVRVKGKHTKDHKKQNRDYRYSEADMLWARYATKEQVAVHFNINVERARQLSWSFRTKYRWLNAIDPRYTGDK